MTDLFYYDLKNKVKIRAEKVKADEYWVKDQDSGVYIPLTGGGGGSGDELPYYAKPAKIDFLSDSLRTTVDHTGIEVDNTSDGTGSMLSPTGLTIGDTNGNESITKDKVNCLTRVHAMEAAPEIIATADAVETRPIVYNPTTNEFRQSGNLSMVSPSGTYRSAMVSSSFGVTRPNDPAWTTTMSTGGFSTASPTHRFQAYSTGSGIVFRNLGTNKGTVIRDSYVRVANMTNDAVSATGDYGSLEENSLRFRVGGVSYAMNHEDIGVTNKLKVLTSAAPGSNSRMLIYDTTTSAFNYTDVPDGGTALPYYLGTEEIVMDNTGENIEHKMTNSRHTILTKDTNIGVSMRKDRLNFGKFNFLGGLDQTIYPNMTVSAAGLYNISEKNTVNLNSGVLTCNARSGSAQPSNKSVIKGAKMIFSSASDQPVNDTVITDTYLAMGQLKSSDDTIYDSVFPNVKLDKEMLIISSSAQNKIRITPTDVIMTGSSGNRSLSYADFGFISNMRYAPNESTVSTDRLLAKDANGDFKYVAVPDSAETSGIVKIIAHDTGSNGLIAMNDAGPENFARPNAVATYSPAGSKPTPKLVTFTDKLLMQCQNLKMNVWYTFTPTSDLFMPITGQLYQHSNAQPVHLIWCRPFITAETDFPLGCIAFKLYNPSVPDKTTSITTNIIWKRESAVNSSNIPATSWL